MISLLLPSRHRPEALKEMVESALETAEGEIEIVVRIDNDDTSYDELKLPNTKFIKGPRDVLSKLWNECHKVAKGPIFMHCGDDIRFRTPGWDRIVKDKFNEFPDKIVFLYGDDGFWTDFGTHGFIHKNWTEAVGYFVPPYFSCDWNDSWLNDVAKMIGRHVKIPIMTEHMHFAFSKREKDEVDKERETRGSEDNVQELYNSKSAERERDAEKLRKVISGR